MADKLDDTDKAPQPRPLTERIIRRLPGPRPVWIVAWALVPLVSPIVYATAIRSSGILFTADDFVNLMATQAVVAYASFVFLLGTGLMARQAASLQGELPRLGAGTLPPDLFRGMGSVGGPILLSVAVAAILSGSGWLRYGPWPPLASLPLLLVYLIPILTFVWVDLTILADLDRLGRQPLALDQFPEDRTLGLDKVGSLASTGLGLVLVAAVPVLIAGSDEPVTLGISLSIVGASVAIFVLSMWRLHRQMAAAKRRYVGVAQRLYREAFAPIQEKATLDRLEAQANALRAAQSLDERAHSLLTWPVNEDTLRFMAVIVTGVVTSLVVRGLFAALGFS